MQYRTDDLSILLSTDWFLQAWGYCGLQSPPQAAAAMSAQCRKIVENFVGGNDRYWDVEYSLQRMNETERQFLQAMSNARLVAHDCNTLSGIIHGRTSCQEVPGNTYLIHSLLTLLVSDAGEEKDLRDGITPAMFAVIHAALNRSADDNYSEIISISTQANSEWDGWVARITSEIPGLLLNTARDVCDYNGSVGMLWGYLRSNMSNAEMSALVRWLNHWGQHLAGVVAVDSFEDIPLGNTTGSSSH